MKKGILNRIFKTKLAVKIWLYMLIPTLFVLLFIQIVLDTYFNTYYVNSAIEDATEDTHYVASSFSDNYTDLLKRFVQETSSADFQTDYLKMRNCSPANYTKVNNALQNLFIDYAQMNNLIESVLFERKEDGDLEPLLFYSYNCRLKKDIASYYNTINTPTSQPIKGITLLGHSASPFLNQPEVISIVIPLKYVVTSDGMVLIAEEEESTDLILYYFLSTTKVTNFLELYCSDNFQGTMYLADSSGQNVSLQNSHSGASRANSEALSSQIKSAINRNANCFQSGSDYVFLSKISSLDLTLINIVPSSRITAKSDNNQTVLFWVEIISVLIITCVSFMISIFVTNPLKKLMGYIHDIKTNNYAGLSEITTKDEIGQLSESIDSMYHTIQQQIVSIKLEEEENYNTKMQLLSEQINPHFLYNALEFINMEVYNNHTEQASGMISNLGNYLRISLAYGENQLLLSQELDQVKAYINIMNYRFNHRIQLSTQIPEALLQKKILKCILQPLVENSLKHGFKIVITNGFPISPLIDISMTLDDSYLVLTVTDNGAGIDIDKAVQIMRNKHTDNSSDKHLGLNNIYQRLTAFYGEAEITFHSIPFFDNKVIIRLPAHFFLSDTPIER